MHGRVPFSRRFLELSPYDLTLILSRFSGFSERRELAGQADIFYHHIAHESLPLFQSAFVYRIYGPCLFEARRPAPLPRARCDQTVSCDRDRQRESRERERERESEHWARLGARGGLSGSPHAQQKKKREHWKEGRKKRERERDRESERGFWGQPAFGRVKRAERERQTKLRD